MALTTLADYKAFFNTSGTTNDVDIQKAIDIAEAIIISFCGRDLNSTSYIQFCDGGQAEILLDFGPVISITEVLEDTVATTDYTIYEDEARLVKGSQIRISYISYAKFNASLKGVKVTYTAGYAVIPDDLIYCANLVAKKIYYDKTKKITAAGDSGAATKRQRLHGEEREKQLINSSNDLTYIGSQASVLPAEVVAILRTYC